MFKLIPHVIPILFKNRLTELTLFITTTCNMKCRHCFVIDELNKKRNFLTLDEIKEMGKHISYMQRVHISGGEPFSRKDLGEVVTTISNDWNAGVICIPNNGWFTDNVVSTIENFGKNGKGHLRIHFSINSPRAEDMDLFTQLEGSFERWRHTVKEAAKVKKKFKNITLIALSTYNEFNENIFTQLSDFIVNNTEVDEFSFHLARGHKSYHPQVNYENYSRVVNDYFKNRYKGHPLLKAYRELVRSEGLKLMTNDEYKPTCKAGSLRVVVGPEGDVYPCEKKGFPNGEDMQNWLIGNLRDHDYNIKKIISLPRNIEQNKCIQGGVCQCNHEIDTSLSLLSKNSFKVKVLKKSASYYLKSKFS
ncbi:MAG: radical SAM protein [Candidatus Electrothrix sp. AR1]|nr:radical SAM protein [Candidatus Electrothrix sp. AR1]